MTPTGTRLLMLVDDEPAQQRLVSALAARAGWRTIAVPDNETALATLGTRDGMSLDAVLIDQSRPDGDPPALVRRIRQRRPKLPVLLLTLDGTSSRSVDAMRAGATDFLVKPIAPERLLRALDAAVDDSAAQGELRPLTEKFAQTMGFESFVGAAPQFRAALAIAAKSARTKAPILIGGENGSGKESLARAMHAASPRSKLPFIVINCDALPLAGIESELFGHQRGAFAGAFETRHGRILEADGGTVFLDQVHTLPLDVQSRLVAFVERGEVQPVGSGIKHRTDIRVIAAHDGTLDQMVATGLFREDLFYKMGVVRIELPPLRERRDDIPPLSRHLLSRIAETTQRHSLGLTDNAMRMLSSYDWPGNVRQLHNVLFRASVLCDTDALTELDFPEIAEAVEWNGGDNMGADLPENASVMLYGPDGHLRALDEIEADVIRLAIGHYRGRMSEVARRLGIGRSTLYRKLTELGIDNAA